MNYFNISHCLREYLKNRFPLSLPFVLTSLWAGTIEVQDEMFFKGNSLKWFPSGDDWKRCTFMRHLECSVNLKGCLELGLKTVGFSVIDLAKDCVQIMQLTHWCRPSWLTRTMCLLWQKAWKNNLGKGFYYSMDFTYVVLLWDCWKFSNHTCKGRAHKVLPSVWDHFWAFHRGKKKMEEYAFT